jgi:hypothetical protein
MTEKQFLRSFEGHARKMKKVISYREMIINLRHPERMWGAHCPFFKLKGSSIDLSDIDPKKHGVYFEINDDRKIICINDNQSGIDKVYRDTVEFWRENKSSDLIAKMVSIIKKLQKQ